MQYIRIFILPSYIYVLAMQKKLHTIQNTNEGITY